MSDKFYAFDNESDFRRVGKAVKIVEKLHSSGMQAPTHVKQDATYATITALIATDNEDDKGKQAKGIEAVFDGASFDFKSASGSQIIYDNEASLEDDATVFMTSNISSKTAMAVGDTVKISHYPNLSDTSDWLVEETGGGVRAWVVITTVTDAANYKGTVLKGPGQTTVVKADIEIQVFGASANPLSVGYANFADKVEDIYYLNGDLLA